MKDKLKDQLIVGSECVARTHGDRLTASVHVGNGRGVPWTGYAPVPLIHELRGFAIEVLVAAGIPREQAIAQVKVTHNEE